jgi:hypothetical protein
MAVGKITGVNRFAYSSARQQITLPTGTLSATLQFKLYPVSGEATPARQSQVFAAGSTANLLTEATAAAGDAQYVLILNPQSGQTFETLVWDLSSDQRWQTYEFDLSAYAGQTILLHFGVYNDGSGGQTGMLVDQVSLVVRGDVGTALTPHAYLPLVFKAG